jgi:hypothetical protein
MATRHDNPGHADIVEPVRLLLRVAELDTAYRSRYLRRAEAVIERVLPRGEYDRLRRVREQIETLGRDADLALDAGDLPRVRDIAERATRLRRTIEGWTELLDLSDAVHRAAPSSLSPFSAAVQGLTAFSALAKLREELIVDLGRLEGLDAEAAPLYLFRREHFEHLRVLDDRDSGTPFASPVWLQRELRDAVHGREWAKVERLASALAAAAPKAAAGPTALAHDRDAIGRPLPEVAALAARQFGFELAELPEIGALAAYVGGARDLGVRRAGHRSLDATLRETLDLLIDHPFVSSAGVAYMPEFGPEPMLVETFPETETEPEHGSRLLEALHLPGRRNRSRIAIERALLDHGDRVLGDLGLDPMHFAVVCIPFDAYLRLAPERGWGRRPLWTHFDGYQVARGPMLRGLVGGDVRFGGPADLCSVGRDYEHQRIIARFAVVRRARLLSSAPGSG